MKLEFVAIIILLFLGLFIQPFSYGVTDFIYRFIIFVIIVYLLYRDLQQHKTTEDIEETEDTRKPELPHDIDNSVSDGWNLGNLLQHDEIIMKYIDDQFSVLANILIPDQGWIFYSVDSKIMNVYKHVSFSETEILNVPYRVDIQGVLQIIENRNQILIEDNLQNANYSLIYYKNSDYNAASFIGIPVLMNGNEKLFITFDSETQEQFNHQDKEIIEKIVSGIQSTLKFRLKSIELLSKMKIKEKLLEFSKSLNQSSSVSSAIDRLSAFVINEFEADRLTISTIKPNEKIATIRKVVGKPDDFGINFEFTIEEGLTGWVISKNKPYLIDDLEKGEYFIPRYSKNEKSNYGLRSFLGTPFFYEQSVFGALTLEHHSPNKYSEFNKQYLQEITNIFTNLFLRKNLKKEI